MTVKWKYEQMNANEGTLLLDGRDILTLKSCGPGHIVDAANRIERALNYYEAMLEKKSDS